MKLSQVLQSLFPGLILLGIFAVMAQNSYGFTLMGISCFGLALLYIIQTILRITEDSNSLERKDIASISELSLLAFLIMLFGFRAFYIKIPYSDIIFITLCTSLIIVYVIIGSGIYNTEKIAGSGIARQLIFFYSSIIIFLLSLGTRIISPSLSEIFGAAGFIASVPFLYSLIRQKKYYNSRNPVTLFQFIVSTGNKAGMLFLFFIFSVIYTGLSASRVIPTIENSDKPGTYIELINQAESGKEKPVNGKYRHEIYKEQMDKFLARHGDLKEK